MKHIIVIETVDPEAGGKPIAEALQRVLLCAVELGVEEGHEDGFKACFVHGRFNQSSAISAVHEMYNAPEWLGGGL